MASVPNGVEILVRPFLVATAVEPGRRTIEPAAPDGIILVSIGKEGGKVLELKFSTFTSVAVDQYTEVSRTTKDKRVENPSDSNQFVNVQQIENIELRSDTSSKSLKLALHNPE